MKIGESIGEVIRYTREGRFRGDGGGPLLVHWNTGGLKLRVFRFQVLRGFRFQRMTQSAKKWKKGLQISDTIK